MEGLIVTLLAVLGVVLALLTAFGLLAPESPAVLKLALVASAGGLGGSLLLWRLTVISFNWWGLVLEIPRGRTEQVLEVLVAGTPHAVLRLRTRWPHHEVRGLRIRLHTHDQEPVDTTLFSEDGTHVYDERDETSYLTHWDHAGLVPLACRTGADNSAYLGVEMGGGKTIHRNSPAQTIEVRVTRGRAEVIRKIFVVRAVDERLQVELDP